MRAVMISLALLAAAASPAVAQSNDAKAKAKELYDSGLRHYNLAEYPEAIKDWKEAYSISKKPLLLFNIGQAYRLSGDCKLAGTFYDSYQREEPNPKNQDELDQALGLCAKEKDKPVDKPTDKPIDKPVDKPTDKPIDKPVDKPVERPITPVVKPADQNQVVVEPKATTTGGGLRKVGIGVGAAGAVLGGLGIYFAMVSANKSNEIDGYTGTWDAEHMGIQSEGERAEKRAWLCGGLGVGAMIAGGVMYVIGGPKAVESNSVTLVPTRGGAAVGWSTRF